MYSYHVWYSSKVKLRVLVIYDQVMSFLQGYVESNCFSTITTSITPLCILSPKYKVHHLNNLFQQFSSCQVSILLSLLNIRSYRNCHNLITVKDTLICKDFLAWHICGFLLNQQSCIILTKESMMQAPIQRNTSGHDRTASYYQFNIRKAL